MPKLSDCRLNAILDHDAAARAGWSLTDLACACLDGGAEWLQLRAKDLPGAELLEAASEIVGLARQAGAIVIVNDRADIAALAGADGVHVGQEDLAPAAVRAIVGAEAIVGLSTHTMTQVANAVEEEPISYLAVGPVFGSATKATGYEPIGLQTVREAARHVRGRPIALVAIGGITLERAPEVLGAGADAVAVISDLLVGGDPGARIRRYLEALRSRV